MYLSLRFKARIILLTSKGTFDTVIDFAYRFCTHGSQNVKPRKFNVYVTMRVIDKVR